MSPWDLRRVVPVAQRVGEVATVTSVELYGTGICVRWLADQAPHDADERFQNQPQVSDDQGSTYSGARLHHRQLSERLAR